jgi:hypothetical protein
MHNFDPLIQDRLSELQHEMQMKIINILMNKRGEEKKSFGEKMNSILQSDVEILKLERFILSRLSLFIGSFPDNR